MPPFQSPDELEHHKQELMKSKDEQSAWEHVQPILQGINGHKMMGRLAAGAILNDLLERYRAGELPPKGMAAWVLERLFSPNEKRVLDRLEVDLAEIEKFGGQVGDNARRSLALIHSIRHIIHEGMKSIGSLPSPPAQRTPQGRKDSPTMLKA